MSYGKISLGAIFFRTWIQLNIIRKDQSQCEKRDKEKEWEQKRVLKLSFGDTRSGIHNTEFRNRYTECTYLYSPQISTN